MVTVTSGDGGKSPLIDNPGSGATTTLAAALGFAGSTMGADLLKAGVLAALEGTYTVVGEDGVRGLRTVLAELILDG